MAVLENQDMIGMISMICSKILQNRSIRLQSESRNSTKTLTERPRNSAMRYLDYEVLITGMLLR